MAIHFNAGVYAVSLLVLAYDIYKVIAGEYNRSDKLYFIGYLGVVLGWIIYVYSFLTDQFGLWDVYNYSSRSADILTKLSSSWSSNGGFIIWMTAVLSLTVFLYRFWRLARNNGFDSKKVGNHIIISNTVIILLIVAIFSSDAFNMLDTVPSDGLGLNPVLKTFWNYIHPPSAILAYALGLATAIWAFSYVDEGATKFLVSFAWLTSTAANFLGGIWSYYTLGWGGYWAWDPVETGMLLPWLLLTAYFHSPYMGKVFRRALLLFAGFSVAFAGYITRGGAVSPLHGFVGVSWTALILLLVGFPFLIYALRIFRSVDYDVFLKSVDSTYEFSMNVTALSLIGIFLVAFIGLSVQSLYLIFIGEEIRISVDYYNYFSFPFAAIFLAFLTGCTLDFIYRDTKGLIKNIILPTLAISIILVLLTWIGLINFSPLSSILTNIVIAFLLPFSTVALISSVIYLIKSLIDKLYIKVGLRMIHIAVPLIFIAILLSGPYAYNQAYFKNIFVGRDQPVYVSGFGLRIRDVDFRGPIGLIALPGAEEIPHAPLVPEEVESIIYMEVVGSDRVIPIKVRFNFGSYLRGAGAIVSEPTVIDNGLDHIYLVVSPNSATDLFYFYGKLINQYRLSSRNNVTRNIYEYILLLMAHGLGIDANKFINDTLSWSPSDSSLKSGFIANVKVVPKVGLLWFGGALLIIGEVITIFIESPIGRRFWPDETG